MTSAFTNSEDIQIVGGATLSPAIMASGDRGEEECRALEEMDTDYSRIRPIYFEQHRGYPRTAPDTEVEGLPETLPVPGSNGLPRQLLALEAFFKTWMPPVTVITVLPHSSWASIVEMSLADMFKYLRAII